MLHDENHAADRGGVVMNHALMQFVQAERFHRADMLFKAGDRGLDESNFQLLHLFPPP